MPFFAADRFDRTVFCPGTDGLGITRTAIRGEIVNLPGNDLSALTNRTFDLPINPYAGYIDASFYQPAPTRHERAASPARYRVEDR
ncbi:hypothetical protein ACIBTZ_21945 [Micromonospora sp. NPDC049460]|uniref:hypothetical protein n=1 Tax=Micromonospora sp. NPDC049460 TaxID=3364272 RepID=UPI0037A40CC4